MRNLPVLEDFVLVKQNKGMKIYLVWSPEPISPDSCRVIRIFTYEEITLIKKSALLNVGLFVPSNGSIGLTWRFVLSHFTVALATSLVTPDWGICATSSSTVVWVAISSADATGISSRMDLREVGLPWDLVSISLAWARYRGIWVRGVVIGEFCVLLPNINHSWVEFLSQYQHPDPFLQLQPLQQWTKARAMIRVKVNHLVQPEFVHPPAVR